MFVTAMSITDAFVTGIFVMEVFVSNRRPRCLCYSCQTYEGGFAGCVGVEAHGGYSFCGLAGLMLLGKECLCDTKSLLVRTYTFI